MVDCLGCGKRKSLFSLLFKNIMENLCVDCYTEKQDKIKKDISLVDSFIKEYNGSEGWNIVRHEQNILVFVKKETIKFNLEEIISLLSKKSLSVKGALNYLLKEEFIRREKERIKSRQKQREIKEEAEKRVYGKIKNKRKILACEERDMIFDKFDNECIICGNKEGLHIHHKDGNPSNNQMNNLVVLCGVCHKKAHMKVR